jgi:hypothetical protein
MRLVAYREKGSTDAAPRAGALVGEQVVVLQAADPSLSADVLGLIQGGPAVLDRARAAVGPRSRLVDDLTPLELELVAGDGRVMRDE